METIQMPKTYRERLNALEVGGSILITSESRSIWSTNVTRIHGDGDKRFSIRTTPENGEIRVWRLIDAKK